MSSPKFLRFLDTNRTNKLIALAVVAAVAGAGVVIVLTKAAGYFAAVEPDTATRTANAKLVNDASASGGKAIQFTAPSSTPPTPPPTPPTPPPTPPPSGGVCPPFPAFPDANCTGWQHTGVTLTAYTGPYVITTPGTVIDGKDITKAISIRASNVTIKRSRIRVPGPAANRYCFNDNIVNVMNANCDAVGIANVILQDVEVDGMGYSGRGEIADGGNNGAIAIDGSGVTCIRCKIHSTGLGMRTGDSGLAGGLIDSYIYNIVDDNVPGAHNDGFLSNGGNNIKIVHNRIEVDNGQTAPIALYGDFAPVTNVLVEKNLLDGGGFCAYGGSLPGKAYPTGTYIRFIDNHFGRKFYSKCGYYGPIAYFNPDFTGNVWSGNVWHDTGQPVPFLRGQ